MKIKTLSWGLTNCDLRGSIIESTACRLWPRGSAYIVSGRTVCLGVSAKELADQLVAV